MSILKTKIYASNVNNLSDARYFAAWGVDYIGFPIDTTISPESIIEIINWVEGPTYVGEVVGIEKPIDFDDIIHQIPFSYLKLSPYFKDKSDIKQPILPSYFLNESSYNKDEFILIIEKQFHDLTKSEKESIYALTKKYKVWLDLSFNPNDLIIILKELNPYGLLVKGGEEERPGVKSFEDLDEIFEILET